MKCFINYYANLDITIIYSLGLRMITTKDVRALLKAKMDSSKLPCSKTKRVSPSSQKQNMILDYIRKEKIKSFGKNQTCNISKVRKEQCEIVEQTDLVKRKSELQSSLVCKAVQYKQREQFNQTAGNRKDERKTFFVTADVSSAIRNIKNNIKVSTNKRTTEGENLMTQEDIDQLFEGTLPDTRIKDKNTILNKIQKILDQDQPNFNPKKTKKSQENVFRDFADSIKYLELEDGEDKLLAAMRQDRLVKISSEHNADKTAKFKEQFIVGKQIGEGAYASVRVAIYNSINKKIAIKIYQKRKIKQPQRKKSVRRQIKILQQLDHKNIVKIFDVVETNNHINLIMEYISGSCLSKYLKSQPDSRLQQQTAKKIFFQLVDSVVYLHKLNICHRDIKLENILLDANLSPKLIDFGFSTCIDNSKKVKMFCGTPSFMAPQIVTKQEYKGPPADIWALGVVLFVMLTGLFPYKGQTDKQLYNKICNADHPSISFLSQDAQNLIRRMFNTNPDERIKGIEILNHAWFDDSQTLQVSKKRRSFVSPSDKSDIGLYLTRGESKKQQNSKQKRAFAQTQSSFVLKQLLQNVRDSQIASPKANNQTACSISKPSPHMLESMKRQSRTDISSRMVTEKLTNKAYF